MITQTKADRLAGALASLIGEQGIAVLHNPVRFRGLLKDEIGGELGAQADLLAKALESNVIGEIVEHREIPLGDAARAEAELGEVVGPDNAPWVLDVWLRGLSLPSTRPPLANNAEASPPLALTQPSPATGPLSPESLPPKPETLPSTAPATAKGVGPTGPGPALAAAAKVPVGALAGGAIVVVLGALGLEFGLHAHDTKTVIASPSAAPQRAEAVTDDAGVARVSYARGNVGIRRADDQRNLVAAAVNAPLFAGDQLATAPSANAEAHLSSDWLVRLDEQTQMRFEDLQPGSREVQLARGDIELRVFGHAPNGPPQVDTPSVAIVPTDVGAYRIGVMPDGRTQIAVTSGRAEVVLPQGDQYVAAGQTAIASGPPTNPQFALAGAPVNDAFGQFNAQRDGDYAALLAQTGGAADGVPELAMYGRWVQSSYGQVWVPRESPQWTPYSEGHWAWSEGYGWTWVPDEAWGWAPYHYGRWFDDPGVGWAWVPGPPAAAWQPAQVAFFVSAGVLAWVALAPGEPYHPWYRAGGYPAAFVAARGVGFGAYRNARDVRAIRSFGLARMARGDFGRTAFVHTADLRRYALLRGGVPVVPQAGALRYSARSVAVPGMVAGASFAGHAARIESVPFSQTRAALGPQGARTAVGSHAVGMSPRHSSRPVSVLTHGPSRVGGTNGTLRSRFVPARPGVGYGSTNRRFVPARPAVAYGSTNRRFVPARPGVAHGTQPGSRFIPGRSGATYGYPRANRFAAPQPGVNRFVPPHSSAGDRQQRGLFGIRNPFHSGRPASSGHGWTPRNLFGGGWKNPFAARRPATSGVSAPASHPAPHNH
jgi:hypothetical protein